ncbi:hypothetical protein AC579_7782 [Pseudocercospora musae]|uniref:Uncharacterized protein n=1 Tax=Pseudocercospora musae TaxID=113226 RepID=A0A139IJQ5_9PEZI|nr:hypothetical protein AC579_7782 [Pseudocercospora musae]
MSVNKHGLTPSLGQWLANDHSSMSASLFFCCSGQYLVQLSGYHSNCHVERRERKYGAGPAEVPEGSTEADYEQELRLAALDEEERQREQEDGMETLGSESDMEPVLGGVTYYLGRPD